MRLIYAEDVLYALVEEGQDNATKYGFHIGDTIKFTPTQVDEIVSRMPTVELEPHWIPCSEKLPEEDDYKPFSYYEDGAVLFCTKNGKVGFGWYYESTKEWANEDDRTPGEVVAWMPLPEPYQEGADE